MIIQHWRAAILLILLATTCCRGASGQPTSAAAPARRKPASVDEARARLLHETIRGTLQIMHRDFFDEDDVHAIPSASFEDVFAELSRRYNVDVKWLNVQTDVLNIEHQPADPFESQATVAINKGELLFEETIKDRYRFAGRIRLGSRCLKCHVKNRITTEDRSAGLLISMPVSISPDSPGVPAP